MTEINVRFKVNDDGTVVLDKIAQKMASVESQTKSMSSSLSLIKMDSLVNLGQRVFQTAQQFYDFGRSLASTGNDIQRMARVFNMSTEDLQKWFYVTKMADVDIEGFGQGFKFLTRSMSEALQGSGDAAKAFDVLGISLKDSTDKTKDQQTVMMEVIGTLEKYADGVDRDALMLAIFGRGWMSVKPLVDQGTKAIEENRKELERLNGILGKNMIEALSGSDAAFKRWETVWKVSKTEFWTPMVQTFTDLLEKILALKTALRGGFGGLWRQMGRHEEEAMEKWQRQMYGDVVADTSTAMRASFDIRAEKKPQAPGLPGKGKMEDYKSSDWIKEWVEGSRELQYMADLVTVALYDSARASAAMRESFSMTDNEIKKDVEGLRAFEYALAIAGAQRAEITWGLQETGGVITKMIEDVRLAKEKFDEIGRDAMGLISSNMINLMSATESWGEKFSKVGESILQTLMQIIVKQLLMKSLFESSAGGGTGFLSSGSWLGSIFGSIGNLLHLQHGGLVTQPTIGMIGEGGPEAVVPLKGGKIPIESKGGGGNYTFISIQATDVKSFEEQLRKNPNAVVEIIYKNARGGGAMKDIVRSMI